MSRKVVLVTGGAGHVGSHVIELLLEDPNNQVISLDNYSNGSEANHISGAEYRRGHTKDIAALFPSAAALGGKPLPPIAELVKVKGDLEKGRAVFERAESSCITCHRVNTTRCCCFRWPA